MRETITNIPKPGITWDDHAGQAYKPGTSVGWTLKVVSTEEGFDALEHDWNTLCKHSACSVFQTYDWARTWWKHFGSTAKRARLHIVVLHSNGEVAAIAPFFSEVMSIVGLAKATRLSFIGRKTSDYLDIIIRDGMHQDVYPQLAEHLSRNKDQWDLIFLEDVPNKSFTHTMAQSTLAFRGMEVTAEITEQCPRIPLPGTWEEYQNRLSRPFQRELRRLQKNLNTHFSAEYETITDRNELDEAFNEFITLHQYRWNKCGEPGVFAEATERAFHNDVVGKLFGKDLVRLNFLRLRGKRVVGSYNFVHGNDFAMYLLGMGDVGEAQRFSPGKMLTFYNIQQAIAEGKNVLDFMRGVEQYKYQLLAENQPNRTLTMYTRPGEAEKVERKRNLNILFESSRKRVAKECTHLFATIRQSGLLSQETLAYIVRRPALIFHDARKKVKAPLLPLYIEESASK